MDRHNDAASSTVPLVDPSMEVDDVSLAPTVPVAPQQSIPSTIVLDPSIQDTAASGRGTASERMWLPLQTASQATGFQQSVGIPGASATHSHPSVHSGDGGHPELSTAAAGSFVSWQEAQSIAQSLGHQSEATSRELANVRAELATLQTGAGQAIQAIAEQRQAESLQVQTRVDATVAQFEAMGAETSARAQQAQQSSAEALQQARQAASIGIQAGSIASEARSTGTEALRRTEALVQWQTKEMDDLKVQMQVMKDMQVESQNLVKQMHDMLVTTQDQLLQSNKNVISVQQQLNSEKEKRVEMERLLQEEKDKTVQLTNAQFSKSRLMQQLMRNC